MVAQYKRSVRKTVQHTKLTVHTETDVTGRVRGWLYGPGMKVIREQDGNQRADVVRRLAAFGVFWLKAFSLPGHIVDGGDL